MAEQFLFLKQKLKKTVIVQEALAAGHKAGAAVAIAEKAAIIKADTTNREITEAAVAEETAEAAVVTAGNSNSF